MRTTINLDEQLLGEAQRITGMKERTALIHAGLRALIEREPMLTTAQAALARSAGVSYVSAIASSSSAAELAVSRSAAAMAISTCDLPVSAASNKCFGGRQS